MNSKKYILFGSGEWGIKAIDILGKESIAFFLDNSSVKWGKEIKGIAIYEPEKMFEKIGQYQVVISVDVNKCDEIKSQLNSRGISDVRTIHDIRNERILERISKSSNNIETYNKAMKWIHADLINGEAMIITSKNRMPYPEVSGYFIPALLRWGEREVAIRIANWLCKTQNSCGGWNGWDGRTSYIFDTAQILKGLLAIREVLKDVEPYIIKACDWIVSCIQEDGRLLQKDVESWTLNSEKAMELVHLYCLSPLYEAADVFGNNRYRIAADKVKDYYKKTMYDDIAHFSMLSHYYAYALEGLVDIGERDIVIDAMNGIKHLQKESGAVPAYCDVDWVCSTGLFQFAIIWYKLGDLESGNKAFDFACALQNATGGWYGSYPDPEKPYEEARYFPSEEISWASKFFLDALWFKNVTEFENLYKNDNNTVFFDEIKSDDDLFKVVKNTVNKENSKREELNILDAGCGKGRYLRNLLSDAPNNHYFAMDISSRVLEYIPADIKNKCVGTLTHIPFEDNKFDMVYTCEALEHAIDTRNAVREMCRVTAPGGVVLIIDKHKEALNELYIMEWEQYFDEKELVEIMQMFCDDVKVISNLRCGNNDNMRWFSAWFGKVKR